MPHPCEVLPHKNILRELLHDVEPPRLLDLQELVRVLCSQQLRLERRVEEGVGSILEELRQTPARKVPKFPANEPVAGQHEFTLANNANSLQIKPTPSTHPSIHPEANGHGEHQDTGEPPVDTDNISNGQLVPSFTNSGLDLGKIDTGEKAMAEKHSNKLNAIAIKTASEAENARKLNSNRTSMVVQFSSASKNLYDKYISKQQSTSFVHECQRSIERLPDGSIRATCLRCNALHHCALHFLKKLCEHPAFSGVAASFIIFNAVIMAASVDWLAHYDTEETWMILGTLVCNIFFIIEIVMRISYQGVTFFTSSERHWNIFDLFMVVLIVFELVASESSLNVGQSIKMVKILRILRIFRLFKFFDDLSLMVTMISGSIKSLFWAWILICFIIFSFSIVLTQFTTFYRNENKDAGEVRERAQEFFGSIPLTAYSLIQAMLNGKSWGEYTDVLLYVDPTAVGIFFFYIALMMIAVMNVITGVFVQDAIQAASTQRDAMISTELRAREQHLENMLDVFTAMDADGSGEISMQEAKEFFRQEVWAAYFNAQGLDVADAEGIFNILDTDNNGSLPFEEFVDGCFKLKGPAKRTDIAAMSQNVHRLNKQITHLTTTLGYDCCASDRKDSVLRCTGKLSSKHS